MSSLLGTIVLQETDGDSGDALIDVVPGLMIWTAITFAIVFFVLRNLAACSITSSAQSSFSGMYTFPDSNTGVTACALATLSADGFTGFIGIFVVSDNS